MKKPLLVTGLALLCALAASAYQAVQRAATAPTSMAAMLPQGALLTIESPDFAGLLHDWNASPEQKSWLASDNYSVFSNSRLFGRLNDARGEFESTANPAENEGPSFDGDFLTQVAGRQSIFAWYDVGNLEFLYISRVSASQAANIALLKERKGWTARQSGGITFYMRKSSDGPAAEAESAQGKARTVAYAQVPDPGGDLLILATREDLIANALALIHPANPRQNAQSVASEQWFVDASAALPPGNSAPALHMVLNLERLVPQPYFRSYWVQRNISAMGQYRAAVSDLHRESGQFREERALLPKASDSEAYQTELSPLVGVLPASGVFRAQATHDPDAAVTALEEKLLGRIKLEALPATEAPDPTLEAEQSGSATDLETRIDTPAPVTPATSNLALTQAIQSAGLDAIATWSSAIPPATPGGLWVPIHSAIVLRGTSPWNPQTVQSSLQQSLRGALTASTLGIEFRPETASGQTIYALTGPKPLFFATAGNLCLLADNRDVLLAMLASHPAAAATQPATQVAGFDHTSQRGPYARLTALIDGTNQGRSNPESHGEPAFFSVDLRSMSDSFAALAGEQFVERRDGETLRQTVTYQWRNP